MELADWCTWLKRRGAGRLRHVLMAEWDPIGEAEVRTEAMEMPPAADADMRTARTLLAWYAKEMARIERSDRPNGS